MVGYMVRSSHRLTVWFELSVGISLYHDERLGQILEDMMVLAYHYNEEKSMPNWGYLLEPDLLSSCADIFQKSSTDRVKPCLKTGDGLEYEQKQANL